MIYIYDLLVNLNEELIDFYDWNEMDNYEHIRKCLLIKINKEDYYNILTNKIKINKELMEEIKNKTQKFSGRNTVTIEYLLVITDGNNALVVKFDKNGISKEKSKLLINEEIEILTLSSSMKIKEIKYSIVNKNTTSNMTRKETQIANRILQELNSIKNDKEKIDYLYYEWFDNKSSNNKLEDLISSIKSNFTSKHKEFLDILNLITNK